MKPWLLLPTKLAHDLAPYLLPIYSWGAKPATGKPFDWRGLKFKNRFSIAGGVDKNAESILSWQKLSVGFLEIGTVTPKPQSPNPGQIMDRDIPRKALWNKMGFPNHGADQVARRVKKVRSQITVPLFINIGKNRDTPNERAHEDYALCADKLHQLADAFVVNISSPNTKGLRHLQNTESVKSLVKAVQHYGRPVLLKLSPDCTDQELFDLIDASLEVDIAGWILTNTTSQPHFDHEGGGTSGEPLTERSAQCLQAVLNHLGDRKADRLVVSVGGVTTPEIALKRLSLGADLVQTYSGLVYHGPHFFQDCTHLMN